MSTKFAAALLSVMLLFVRSVSAESPNERDFKQLRADRDKAAAAAMEPVNRHYREGLDKLFRRATQAAELDLAKEIQAELQGAGGAAAVVAATGTGAPLATNPPVDKADLRKLFEETEWESFKGSSSAVTFLFGRGGNFTSSGSFGKFYTLEAPDVLKLWGADPKKDRKAAFRLFRVNVAEKTAVQDLKASTVSGELSLKYVGPAKTPKK